MKMRRNKWYKRILPMLLSVAMLIETVPQTVLAAGYADVDSAAEETTLDETAAEVSVEDSGAELLAETGGSTDGIPQAVLSINESRLANYLNRYYDYSYNYVTGTVTAAYEEADPNYAGLDDLVKSSYYIGAEAEGTLVDFEDKLAVEWQQWNGSDYVKMTEKPHNEGNYRLQISLPGQEGAYRASEPVYLNLVVEKVVLVLDGVNTNISPGWYVSDLTKQNSKENLSLYQRLPNGNNRYGFDDINTYVTDELSYTVTDAHNGDICSPKDVLQKNQDYYLEISATVVDNKKDHYEVENWVGPVKLSDTPYTWIKVTYTNEGKTIGKTYDGTPFTAAEVEAEYKAEVIYTKDGEEKVLEDAVITGTWCDVYQDEYKDANFAPVDAGTYYYKLSYKDENGTYTSAYEYVEVEIAKAVIIIKPVADDLKVYQGMTAGEVVKNVKYEVYEVKDGVLSSEALTIDDYFWGVYSSSLTQKYEPLFNIQMSNTKNEEGQFINWSPLSDSDTIQKSDDVSYRIIFSGSKVAYYATGGYTTSGINNSLKNYQVDTESDTRAQYTVSFAVLPATKAVINVDAILQEEGSKGKTQESPIVKIYDGESLYQSRSEYKKAVVTTESGNKIAENSDNKLKYTWYSAYYTWKDDEGKYQVSYTQMNNDEIPCDAGVYRLTVSYEGSRADSEEDTYTYADAVNVYYVIQPQSAILTLSGEPAVYADGVNTVESFLNNIYRQSVKVEAYPVTVTEDEQGKVTVTKGAAAIDSSLLGDYYYDFFVEKKATADGNESWVYCDYDELFVKGTEYRLCVDLDGIDNGNYNFGAKLDVLNLVEKRNYYENESLAIELKETAGKEVTIKVDETKLANTTKIYDGKPFDLEELKSLVTVEADGQDVKNQVELYYAMEYYDYYSDERSSSVEYAIHANEYRVYIYTETDDTYKSASKTLDTIYTITPRALTLTPVLEENIKAGSWADAYDIVSDYKVDGLAETDDVDKVIDEVDWKVCESNSNDEFYGTLRSSMTYYVQGTYVYYNYDEDWDWRYGYFSYENDYEVKVYERVAFTPERVAARVDEYASSSPYNTKVKDSVNGNKEGNFEHTIEAIESVPYAYSLDIDGSYREGNFFLFRIYAPSEFNNGWYSFSGSDFVYRNSIEKAGGYVYSDTTYSSTPYLTVAFDVSQGGKPSFDVLWEKGYAETFIVNLAGMVSEADLTKAVAPKSLSFNGANTKMAVGDTQQLDVKITKAQMSDTILLGYSVDNENVCEVSDTGYVTAISKGSATVTVYPCRYEYVNGVRTKNPITGKGVKSAKVKITVSDVAAPKVSKVNAGDTSAVIQYTRPANGYRREIYVMNGKKTVAQFESEIAKVQNGDYSAFVFVTTRSSESVITSYLLSGLAPASEYTVYVRNVSQVRTLTSGRQVAESHAGSVKTFKTVMSQAAALNATVVAAKKGQSVTYDEYNNYYRVNLADKSAKLSLEAKFREMYAQGKYSEDEYTWISLPLSGNVKKNYTAPKLVYTVSNSNIATVDKGGKITFKGRGTVTVYATDSNTGKETSVRLNIYASPDSVTGKSIKLRPGQTINLVNYLEYKEKKTKIANYAYSYADLIITTKSDEYFEIENYGDECYITALKPGGKLDLEVIDRTVQANGGKSAKIKLSSTAVEPVKNLKASEVYDKKFKVTFTYPEYYYDFRIALRDARGNVISDKLEEDMWRTRYDSKAKRYVYEVEFSDSITLLSNYTVTVTALCNGVSSKEAKLKVKTTNIPASYRDVDNGDSSATINVSTGKSGSYSLSSMTLISGNTYTLDMPLNNSTYYDNVAARTRLTDTLIWKSSDPKVATVKANTGSFSAKLKTVKQGSTTIEVSSKITKKVIARYTVYVSAVGDAYSFYGDSETYRVDRDPIIVVFNEIDSLIDSTVRLSKVN